MIYEYENTPLAEVEQYLIDREAEHRNLVALKNRLETDTQFAKDQPDLVALDLSTKIAEIEALIIDKRAERDALNNPVQTAKDQILAEINAKQVKERAIQELVADPNIANADIVEVTGAILAEAEKK